MKKSLVIISFAFIFLLSVSIVSANFFDWITGDVESTITKGDAPLSIKQGETETLGSYDVQVTRVEGGVVEATVTSSDGAIQNVKLQEGRTAILSSGEVLKIGAVSEGGFLRKPRTEISISEAGLTAGTEGATFSSPITQAVPFTKGEYTIGDDVWVLEEGEGDTLTLTINGLYEAGLKEGVYNIPALCTGNHVVTISDGMMTVDTLSNTLTAAASQF